MIIITLYGEFFGSRPLRGFAYGLLALLFAVPTYAQFNGPPDFYAVEVEGEGSALRRRLVRIDGQTGYTEIISGALSVEGEPTPERPLFDRSVISWPGFGAASYVDNDAVYSFDAPRGEPRVLGTANLPNHIEQLFSINSDIHLYSESPLRVTRVNLATRQKNRLTDLTNLLSFDPATFTIINAEILGRGVLLRRQSVIDDSFEYVGYWNLNSFKDTNMVIPFSDDEQLVRTQSEEVIDDVEYEVTRFYRWANFRGEVTLHQEFSWRANSLDPNPFEDRLSDVIGASDTHYIVPPPTRESGSYASYIVLVDKQTLEVSDGISTLFRWDSHFFGRTFFSDPSLVELEPGKFYTGLMAREFSPDYSSSTDTVLYIKQADGPVITIRGTGPDLPPFVGLSVDTFNPNPAQVYYLGGDAVIEIDTATGNRRTISEIPDNRFIVGSGTPVAPR